MLRFHEIFRSGERIDDRHFFSQAYPARHNLKIDSTGNPHIVYGGDHLYHTWWGLGTWHTEVVDSALNVGSYASLAIDGVDKLHIAYYDAANGDLKYATNRYGYWLISTLVSSGNVGAGTDIGVSGQDPYIVYRDNTNTHLMLLFMENGTIYETPENISGSLVPLNFAMASRNFQDIHVVFNSIHDTGSELEGTLYYTSSKQSSPWMPDATPFTGDANMGSLADIAVDSNSYPHVVLWYSDDEVQITRYLYSDDHGLSWTGFGEGLGVLNVIPQGLAMVLNPANQPTVALQAGGKLYKYTCESDESAWVSALVDTRNGTGFYPAVALYPASTSNSGNPAFAYLEAPIVRLGGADVPIPYNPRLEKAAVPQVEDIVAGGSGNDPAAEHSVVLIEDRKLARGDRPLRLSEFQSPLLCSCGGEFRRCRGVAAADLHQTLPGKRGLLPEPADLPEGEPGGRDEVEEPSRRRDQEIAAARERLLLVPARRAAVRDDRRRADAPPEPLRLPRDLERQLPRRADDDRLRVGAARRHPVEDRKEERERLARAGLGDADQIASREEDGDRSLLDRGGLDVAGLGERPLQLLAKPESREILRHRGDTSTRRERGGGLSTRSTPRAGAGRFACGGCRPGRGSGRAPSPRGGGSRREGAAARPRGARPPTTRRGAGSRPATRSRCRPPRRSAGS